MHKRFHNAIIFLMAFFFLGTMTLRTVGQSATGNNLLAQTSEVHPLMVEYEADKGSLQRFYFIPASPERRTRFQQFQQDYLKRLDALPFEKMSLDGQADYILFRNMLRNELRLLENEKDVYNKLSYLIPFAPGMYALEQKRRRGSTPDPQGVAAEMRSWQESLEKMIEWLSASPEVGVANAASAEYAVKGLQTALRSVYDFYNGYNPAFSAAVPAAYVPVDSLLTVYATLLRSKEKPARNGKADGSGITGQPIGRRELLEQLQFAMIPYSPEEIIAMANKEFTWCDQEMLKASKEMGFGNEWKKALEKVKNSYVREGEQPATILRLHQESIDFIRKHDLVTIPPLADETWRMMMMSERQQLIAPFFLGGETILIAYPTQTMKPEDKLMTMRGNNPHFSRAIVHHELIAGHHLQGFMNNRYKTYRNFDTPFWTEGWSLYWEFILWDLQFPQSPEDKVGMLFWRMHRCARIIFSLNYHLGRWTPQECIDFLVDRVGHEPANAAGEVRRSFTGGYGPLYQLAYMVGGQQFYALKKELVDTGKMTWKQFHDAILKENNMPVEMVRVLLKRIPLQKEFTTSWKFYGK